MAVDESHARANRSRFGLWPWRDRQPEPDFSVWGDISDYYRLGDRIARPLQAEYRRRKARHRRGFIFVAMGLLLLTSSLPLLAGVADPLTLGIIGVVIAFLAGFRNLFELEHNWAALRWFEISLTNALAAWELGMMYTRQNLTGSPAKEQAFLLTRALLREVGEITSKTSREILGSGPWPSVGDLDEIEQFKEPDILKAIDELKPSKERVGHRAVALAVRVGKRLRPFFLH